MSQTRPISSKSPTILSAVESSLLPTMRFVSGGPWTVATSYGSAWTRALRNRQRRSKTTASSCTTARASKESRSLHIVGPEARYGLPEQDSPYAHTIHGGASSRRTVLPNQYSNSMAPSNHSRATMGTGSLKREATSYPETAMHSSSSGWKTSRAGMDKYWSMALPGNIEN